MSCRSVQALETDNTPSYEWIFSSSLPRPSHRPDTQPLSIHTPHPYPNTLLLTSFNSQTLKSSTYTLKPPSPLSPSSFTPLFTSVMHTQTYPPPTPYAHTLRSRPFPATNAEASCITPPPSPFYSPTTSASTLPQTSWSTLTLNHLN